MQNLLQADEQLGLQLREIRRHLHRHPELSGRENQTCIYIQQQLAQLGIPGQVVHGTGVLARIGTIGTNEDHDGPIVALRADIDALPLQEDTGLPFASQNPGVMHACGHDGHVAMLLGAAALLQKLPRLAGEVRLLFQPAEEADGGAEGMIAAGALAGVGAIFAGHLDRHLPVGQIAVQPGPICASTDDFLITCTSRGGHAGKPQESPDCIVAAASLVLNLQTLVSRCCDPAEPAVVNVGLIRGGTAVNIIAGQVELAGTIRAISPATRQILLAGLQQQCRATALGSGVAIIPRITPGAPPLINHPEASALARRVAEELLGVDQVPGLAAPSLGGEDFAFYLQQIPGCMVRFGAAKEEKPDGPAHSPSFDFAEEALPVGAAFLANLALAYLERAALSAPEKAPAIGRKN